MAGRAETRDQVWQALAARGGRIYALSAPDTALGVLGMILAALITYEDCAHRGRMEPS
jgi:hypothetical protein